MTFLWFCYIGYMTILPPDISRWILLLLSLAGLADPVFAQKSALLVAIGSRQNESTTEFVEQRFRTFLIETDGERASLVATLPDIIVPHGNGFWRAGVITSCSVSTAPEVAPGKEQEVPAEDDSFWDEAFFFSPVDKNSPIPPLGRVEPCDHRSRGEVRDAASRIGLYMPSAPCTFHTESIAFVSSQLVAVNYYYGQSEACEPRGFHWNSESKVLRFGGTDSISFKELTGDAGWEAYNTAVRKASADLQKEGFNCDIFSEEDEVLEDTHWTLRRKEGRWAAVLAWHNDSAACEYFADIDLKLPKSLTDYDTLQLPWSSLAKQAKNLQDVFTSPSGNLLLARTNEGTAVYSLREGHAGPKLLDLPTGKIVMVQWALGKYADSWAKELAEWQRNGLPHYTPQSDSSPQR
jgi:hypothetical protein